MRTVLLLSAALLVAGPANAAGWEEKAARLGRQAALAAGAFAPLSAARSRVLAGAPKSTDLSVMFELGAKPAAEDLRGWFAGRRFTESGPAAALLVGGELYDDPASGPISGKSFKLMVFGPKAAGLVPADIYDEPGTPVVDAVQGLIVEQAAAWSAIGFTELGAVWSKGGETYELRKWGKYLVCKYPEGYGYFFKQVSPLAPAAAKRASAAGEALEPAGPQAELESRFDSSGAPEERELLGWFAGRRFTESGPVAALLAGFEVYDDPEAGPIEGSAFKLVVLGPDRPGLVPVNLYDQAGWALINGIAWTLRQTAGDWSTRRAGRGVVTESAGRSYELRTSGDYLLLRYPAASASGATGLGYFFKRIR
ncbi:MAG: hypothetical protein HY554_10415 [Elusimicrobia bacterium]|nr:hypothetical protein [Elusimicrobiota bacterium]